MLVCSAMRKCRISEDMPGRWAVSVTDHNRIFDVQMQDVHIKYALLAGFSEIGRLSNRLWRGSDGRSRAESEKHPVL